MEMEYEDFYDNYTEFDVQIDEFKKSLLTSVKKEFLDEMNALKKENEELQEVKRNWEKIQQEYQWKQLELEGEKSRAKTETRKERLSELFQDKQLILYNPAIKYSENPKCNKCNKDRKIPYISPLGNNLFENCVCSEPKKEYFPEKYIWYEFRLNNYDKELNVWYKALKSSSDSDQEYFEADSNTRSVKEIYTSEKNFENLDKYWTFFKTEEECQKYCDWLNQKNNKT
jgi:hypothetical protein